MVPVESHLVACDEDGCPGEEAGDGLAGCVLQEGAVELHRAVLLLLLDDDAPPVQISRGATRGRQGRGGDDRRGRRPRHGGHGFSHPGGWDTDYVMLVIVTQSVPK